MKRSLIPICLAATFLMAGCGGNASQTAMQDETESAQVEPAPVIELTSDEEALLDTSSVSDEAEPVTPENYEEALQELEDALNSEQ